MPPPAQDAVPAPGTRIYASNDHGQSWHPSGAGFPSRATVNDFTVAHDAVFAGAGADGVFVSRDAGRTWRLAVAALGTNGTVNAMASTSTVLLAGTRRDGVFASRDAGKTWTAANQGLTSREVRRLVADGGRVFAATNGGLFVSEDDAASWRHLTGNGQTNGFVALHGDLYVSDVHGILRSHDEGRTWRRVHDEGTPHNLATDGTTLFAMLYGRGVVRTADGGRTWQSAQKGLPADLGQYTFQIVPADGALFAAQWHGIYVSESRGDAWRISSQGLSSDQAITDIVRVAPDVLLAAAVASAPKP